jgi:hypothetical protein
LSIALLLQKERTAATFDKSLSVFILENRKIVIVPRIYAFERHELRKAFVSPEPVADLGIVVNRTCYGPEKGARSVEKYLQAARPR